jgi:uncharacterized protein YhhL (DUF1145 family)
MDFNIDIPIDVVGIMFSIVSCALLIFWTSRTLRKKQVTLKIWKVFVFTIVGIFSFSINFSIFGTLVKFSVLPLGVWILYGWYFKSKKNTWINYREFAWIGFFSNFFFLMATLFSPLVHNLIYPKDEPTTYLSNVENASIIKIHSSGIYQTINRITLQKQIGTMEKATIYNDKWYEETFMGETSKDERFPFQLLGVLPKWGIGIQSVIFIEKDGKGILIDTPKKQLYFRSENVFLEGVNDNE